MSCDIRDELEYMRVARALTENPEHINRIYLEGQLLKYDALHNADRKGTWFPVFSGIRFWPEDPRVEEISVFDIGHCLARINRYNGHTKHSYSVAQHSILVADLIEATIGDVCWNDQELKRSFVLMGLLHDLGEAYLGDVITPIKRLIRDLYEPMEEKIVRVAARKFGCEAILNSDTLMRCVKMADQILLVTEVRDLTTSGALNIKVNGRLPKPLPNRIARCWSNEEAEERFLERFHELFEAKDGQATNREESVQV